MSVEMWLKNGENFSRTSAGIFLHRLTLEMKRRKFSFFFSHRFFRYLSWWRSVYNMENISLFTNLTAVNFRELFQMLFESSNIDSIVICTSNIQTEPSRSKVERASYEHCRNSHNTIYLDVTVWMGVQFEECQTCDYMWTFAGTQVVKMRMKMAKMVDIWIFHILSISFVFVFHILYERWEKYSRPQEID